jgi:phospholipase/lecithinase/hemolysin
VIFLVWGFTVSPVHAAFNAFYVFGDGACTTTSNVSGLPYYYGKRFSNGRVWVEVLTQRQGLTYNPGNNWSYYGHTSGALVTNVSHFTPPLNASNALFAVWCCDADFVLDIGNPSFGPAFDSTKLSIWTNAINLHLANHFKAITNLYAKGVRYLIAPNAVDLTKIPANNGNFYTSTSQQTFVRQRISDFNTAYVSLLNQIQASRPDLIIWVPDVFSLMDDVESHAAKYGLTNRLDPSGIIWDAVDAGFTATNGIGTNYIWWDPFDPTAKFHEVIADYIQQLISPAQIAGLDPESGGNELTVINLPVGLSGFVDGKSDLLSTNWVSAQGFNSTNLTQAIFVPASNTQQFYRLHFPYAWSWP